MTLGGYAANSTALGAYFAIRALEKVADQFGDKIVLGAGTVLDPETARACMLAGAEFFVTPSLRVSTIEMVKRYSKVVCPGALTPTEVLTGLRPPPCLCRSGDPRRSRLRRRTTNLRSRLTREKPRKRGEPPFAWPDCCGAWPR